MPVFLPAFFEEAGKDADEPTGVPSRSGRSTLR